MLIKKNEKLKTEKVKSTKEIMNDLNRQRYQNMAYMKKKAAKKVKMKLLEPKTPNEVIQAFFQDFDVDTKLFKIADEKYSACYEYSDINFAKADSEEALNILIKWRDYLNSLNESLHAQVVNANTPIITEDFKKRYRLHAQPGMNPNFDKLANEFNGIMSRTIGESDFTLATHRYLVITVDAKSYKEAYKQLLDVEHSAYQKFRELDSSLRMVEVEERLELLYDLFNLHPHEVDGYKNILESVKEMKDSTGHPYTVCDLIAPKYLNMREDDLIEIHESNTPGSTQKFIRVMYVAQLPSTMTPRFYNRITSIENVNSIVTLNIQPKNNGKFLKAVGKQITGIKSERLQKIKKANKNGYSYDAVRDENLEDRLAKFLEVRDDLLKNNQRVFDNNMLIVLIADNYNDLNNATFKAMEVASEMIVDIKALRWLQLEGLINALPFGHNTLHLQRTLTSDATALNVPFSSKDIMDVEGIYAGQNLISKRGIWLDRRKLKNGNGAVLATSGAGKSFYIKDYIEQLLLKYPEDEVVILDPQGEYKPIIDALDGETVKLSPNSDTYINPFDADLNYGLDEDGKADPVKEKTEYILAFCQSLLSSTGEVALTGEERSIIDRCCGLIYADAEMHRFAKEYMPNLDKFYNALLEQNEYDAKNLALTLERFVHGSLSIFSHDTNVKIKKRLISFDISALPSSMQTTGYLVILDHVMNRLAHNHSLGRNTWLFIDEFHILLANSYAASYVAKIYKVGRKFNAYNTIITQNIADVLNNEQGRKMLSNSEFACILKQKALDLPNIQEIFDISSELATYVQDPPHGQGIVVYGKDKMPFYFPVGKDTYIYQLNNTSGRVMWE